MIVYDVWRSVGFEGFGMALNMYRMCGYYGRV